MSALQWNPSEPVESNAFHVTRGVLDGKDLRLAESTRTPFVDTSEFEEDEEHAKSDHWSDENKPTQEEEDEALRSARELFEAEEELRDVHFACLQVIISCICGQIISSISAYFHSLFLCVLQLSGHGENVARRIRYDSGYGNKCKHH